MLALRELTMRRSRKSPGRGGGGGVLFEIFLRNINGLTISGAH
jgi:hypothetical protein